MKIQTQISFNHIPRSLKNVLYTVDYKLGNLDFNKHEFTTVSNSTVNMTDNHTVKIQSNIRTVRCFSELYKKRSWNDAFLSMSAKTDTDTNEAPTKKQKKTQ